MHRPMHQPTHTRPQRLKVTVSAFQDLDFASESRMLLEAIERWA